MSNPYAGMSEEQMEAAFTAEDPRYPARKAAAEALHTYVSEWIEHYELDDGEHRPHAPSEFEQFVILDAFHGLTGDDEYQRLDAAWRSLSSHGDPVAAAKVLHSAALASVTHLMAGDPAKDSPQGRALDVLSAAVEAYELATLRPPLGSAFPSVVAPCGEVKS
jgi:hypothetical protein